MIEGLGAEWLLAIGAVALLYSSVGHGGASGYLAVMALASVSPKTMSATALILNVVVSTIALASFAHAGWLRWRIVWPFLAGSVPFAYVGGALAVKDRVYFWLLGLALAFAALRMLLVLRAAAEKAEREPPLAAALPAGAGIGFLSGVVGVGGGIFLSPLLILCRWANAKETAAASALFILVNSVAGLAGRAANWPSDLAAAVPLLAAAAAGGLAGSYIGARKLPNIALCRALGVVMLIASFKMFLK